MFDLHSLVLFGHLHIWDVWDIADGTFTNMDLWIRSDIEPAPKSARHWHALQEIANDVANLVGRQENFGGIKPSSCIVSDGG